MFLLSPRTTYTPIINEADISGNKFGFLNLVEYLERSTTWIDQSCDVSLHKFKLSRTTLLEPKSLFQKSVGINNK